MDKTSDGLRKSFLNFFRERAHTVVKSSPVVPESDPTLLFTNAGMNQFKEYFLDVVKCAFKRAVSVQKCIRASGKHNDLEDVGRDGRHHTFFEMLGNWSFGDYYKEDAIRWAWEYVTAVLELEEENLWASVYTDDDEAYGIWKDKIGLDPSRIVRLGNIEEHDEENFWSMGETGPCGPCSELYYDYEPGLEDDFKEKSDRGIIVELWNLVFMEFNREAGGRLVPLPNRSIDTGMGLERTLAVLKNVRSNYETDLFMPIIKAVEEESGTKCDDSNAVSFQVIADHIRALLFSISDGVMPSNEGRGYVIRRILRRAVRHGKILGLDRPFLHKLVRTVVRVMGEAYPEVSDRRPFVEEVIRNEEELFLKTLDRGIEEFEKTARTLAKGDAFPGETAFTLHDTYGFPFDLTRIMAEEKGLTVERGGFEAEMERQRQRARSRSSFGPGGTEEMEWTELRKLDRTVFTGYDRLEEEDMHIVRYGEKDGMFRIVFDKTPFYAESGGQTGDTGAIEGKGFSFEVTGTVRSGDLIVHTGRLTGKLEDVECRGKVDGERRARIAANHTATHLLHYALRKTVGSHTTQAGSSVQPERLRFDFNHYGPLDGNEIERIEEMVNGIVLRNVEVRVIESVPMARAREMGAVALFGEKYGEEVRVVKVDEMSIELCGGTHVKRTGDIGLFRIIRESSISSGVRRIEAVSNRDALSLMKKRDSLLDEASALLGTEAEEVPARIRDLLKRQQDLKRQLRKKQGEALSGFDDKMDFVTAGAYRTALIRLDNPSLEEMRETADRVRNAAEDSVVLVVSAGGETVRVILAVSEKSVKSGVHAGKLLQKVFEETAGRGGGKPHMAQGGGINPDEVEGVYGRMNELLKAY